MIDLIIRRPKNLKNELLSGLTVALALVPEAVAFAFVAGVSLVRFFVRAEIDKEDTACDV